MSRQPFKRDRLVARGIPGLPVLFLVALPSQGLADLVDVANIVRTRHCGEATLPDQPLVGSPHLDEAAALVADGSEVTAAIAASGYRAKASASIRIRTPKGRDDAVAKALAERLCGIVADPELTEIGVYRSGKEVWMVLADGAPLPSPEDEGLVRRVLETLNGIRSEGGSCGEREFPPAAPLRSSAALEQAARAHADDMAGNSFLSHTGSDGSEPSDRGTAAGYEWKIIAENIAAGQATVEDVAATWLESPGHCSNLMDPKYSETGIAYALNPGDGRDIYWVQVYAKPD